MPTAARLQRMTRSQRERTREQCRTWNHQRHARGICHAPGCRRRCAVNPITHAEYWYCDDCRAGSYNAARRARWKGRQ